ncbi:diguanylate cyclase (GGDEF)-like protein [Neorhizobium galegae]|uniref:GGDEF domain-containing protein n=1 Tax=Neorhizobium galegae TaxID=399 RepID=UPI001AE15360|nr:GGDEF domain-containing protein [Neorhizobium galegae]MBP2547264.1 diguanylate cyclase (GGDEF)-like protein [Neorhizobium galegae]
MDIKTAMLLWAVESLTLAVLLLAMWFRDRSMKVVLAWSFGFAAHGTGIALVGARGFVPDTLSIILGNQMMLFGIICWCAGMQLYDGKKLHAMLLLPLIIWLAAMQVHLINAQFWTRVLVFQLCGSICYGMLGYLMLRASAPPRGPRRIFAGVCALQAGTMLVTALRSPIVRPQNFTELPNVTLYTVIGIFCLVSGILLGAQLLMARGEERLRQLVITDPLTGVLNRRGFLEKFDDMRQRPPAGKLMLALAIFDLDHFKDINDRFGHVCGDAVLLAFCHLAQEQIGNRGIFGRLGGEEFAGLLHVASTEEAVELTESIRLALQRLPIPTGSNLPAISATVSAGLTAAPLMTAGIDQLLAVADRALYAAKSAGRNSTVLDDGMTIAVVSGQELRPADSQTVTPFPAQTLTA